MMHFLYGVTLHVRRVDGCCVCVACEYEKGIWWMPWHQEAMKDVARCEKPWEPRAGIDRGYLNGETHLAIGIID